VGCPPLKRNEKKETQPKSFLLQDREKEVLDQVQGEIGQEITVTVTHIAQNEKILTLVAEIPEKFKAEPKTYHITLATANGSVAPYYSNVLLDSLMRKDRKEEGKLIPVSPLTLKGTLEGLY